MTVRELIMSLIEDCAMDAEVKISFFEFGAAEFVQRDIEVDFSAANLVVIREEEK